MRRNLIAGLALTWLAAGLAGCGMRPQGAIPPPQPVLQQHEYSPPVMNVFNWRSVPVGQRVPVERAAFDRDGYQITTPDGVIVIPFANQNLYVLKFARSQNGGTYFENQGAAPALYLASGFGLANAAAQNAMWYPLPDSYQPASPVYVGLAPSWNEYASMGWYPGMNYYGGLYSPYYHPGMMFHSWTPGYVVNVGGRRYANYRSYTNYYHATPGFAKVANGGAIYHQPRATRYVSHGNNTAFGNNTPGNSGSFRTQRRPSNTPDLGGTTGTRPRSSFGSAPAFHNAPRVGGSFGSGNRRSAAPDSSSNSGGRSAAPASSGGGSGRSSGGGSFGRSGGFGGGSSSGRSSSGGSSSGRSSGGSSGGGRRR